MPVQLDPRAVDVAAFTAQARAHLDALRKYKTHIANGGQFYPPPDAPAEIKAAIDEQKMTLAIEVLKVPLEDRRKALRARVDEAHTQALTSILLPAKRRLLELDCVEAMEKREADRTEADNAAIKAMETLRAKQRVVGRYAATLHVAIDDLDETTIDTWRALPFPLEA